MSALFLITFLGREWNIPTAVFVLMAVQIAIIVVCLVIFVILMLRKYVFNGGKQYIDIDSNVIKKGRSLLGITLETSSVKKEFKLYERFSSDGLIVTANYSDEPRHEIVGDFVVEEPALDKEGKFFVTVRYRDFSAVYPINVVLGTEERKPISLYLDIGAVKREFCVGDTFTYEGLNVVANYETEPVSEVVYDYTVDEPSLEEEGLPAVTVHYAGLTAAYSVSVHLPELVTTPERKLLYIELDTDCVKTEFAMTDVFSYDGLKVFAHYSSDPEVEEVHDYTVDEPDFSTDGIKEIIVRYGGLEQKYSISVEKLRSLIGISVDTTNVKCDFSVGEQFTYDGLEVTAFYDAEPTIEKVTDFIVEQPNLNEVGKQNVTVSYFDKSAVYSISVLSEEDEERLEIDEESVAAGVLRYDRSFTARFIQSDDEIKHWYTLIKNELLSYRKVKDRMSWKRETFRFGRAPVARLGYRGKMLCLFLPLDPNAYTDTKFKVEDVSDNKTYADTPCMYRIKNDRRVKYAMDLISTVMENMGIKRIDRISEDYYLPYEGVVELINKGLIKRNIKSGEDEAFFKRARIETQDKKAEDSAEETKPETIEKKPEPEVIAEETKPETIENSEPEVPAEETKPETIEKNPEPEVIAEETKPETIENLEPEEPAEETKPETIEENPEPEVPAEETKPETIEKNPEPEVIAEETVPETIEENLEPEVPAEETKPETIENSEPEVIAEETKPETIENSEPEVIAEETKPETIENPEPETSYEEAAATVEEAGYDRSFRAKLIQSDDEVKTWYGIIKNELVSYNNIKCKFSWKNETFKANGNRLAKLGFRGRTLCLFLPLKASDYEGKYKVHDLSGSTNYGDTPLMYKIKSEKRARFALDLIGDAMAKFKVKKFAHETQDFYEPYQDDETLEQRGLIKREEAFPKA